jgi:hypothetical protein
MTNPALEGGPYWASRMTEREDYETLLRRTEEEEARNTLKLLAIEGMLLMTTQPSLP